jgi:hypothetical protein
MVTPERTAVLFHFFIGHDWTSEFSQLSLGFSLFVLHNLYMTPVQVKFTQKAVRVSQRKAAEASKSISDLRNQIVIV